MRRLYVLFGLTLLLGGAANAQIGSPAPWSSGANNRTKPSPTPPSPTPQNVPIDGGLGILIAAGVLYGGRAYRNHKKASVSVL